MTGYRTKTQNARKMKENAKWHRKETIMEKHATAWKGKGKGKHRKDKHVKPKDDRPPF